MKYTLQLQINKPIKEVTRLFASRSLLQQWQPELQHSKQLENFPHPKYSHQIALGRRTMTLTETIVQQDLPEQYQVEYSLKNIKQSVHHRFSASETGSTYWEVTTVYSFKGIMKLISLFSKSSLKKQSEIMMRNFKGFAESQ